MLHALVLSLGQMARPPVLRLVLRCLLIALVVTAGLALAGWQLLVAGIGRTGLADPLLPKDSALLSALSALAALLLAWLLWRIVAMAVLQFHADEVVRAVEAQHYPQAAANARRLGFGEEARIAAAGALRALLVNLAALPFALALLVTGIGAPLLFWAVNAVLLGRELMDMVWLRHRASAAEAPPLSRLDRFLLGGVVAGLLAVPFANLLAPFIGAAMAAHLVHRRSAQARPA